MPAQNSAPEGEDAPAMDPVLFARNMATVARQSQRLIADFLMRQAGKAGTQEPDPLNISAAFSAVLKSFAADPAKILDAQFALFKDHMNLWSTVAKRLLGEKVDPVVLPGAGDRRFRAKEWEENQIFDFIKQSYLLTANWLQRTVHDAEG